MEKFAKLGLSQEVLSVLKSKGFHEPTEIQEKAIPLALAGKDIIGSSATGSGKTLAFASSIIENLKPNRNVQALILTPTRELAEQVAESIRHFSKNKNLSVSAVYGGVDIQRQIRQIYKTDILVGTPGRILDHLQRKTLRLDQVKFLVLDEVDRMLDMGFHQSVEAIIRQCPVKRQTMLFSATISSDFDHLVKKYTQNPEEVSATPMVENSKLNQIYYDVPSDQKFSLLVHLLKEENSELAMIFCATRRNADIIARSLNEFGIRAMAIHGGLVQNKRQNILREFHNKIFNILVCTDVAARGLDIKNVTHVYNYDLPKDSNDYIHRIGRTARAGENGKVINILSNRDYENFRNIQRNSSLVITPEKLPFIEKVRVNYSNHDRRDSQNRGNRYSHNNSSRDTRRFPPRKRFDSRNSRGRNSRFR
jgi:ATP-dependent RNA helicase DeaD